MSDLPLPDFDEAYYSTGGLITSHNGVADRLLQNNDLYNKLKGDWDMTMHSHNKNFSWRIGKNDGRNFIQRTQRNIEDIKRRCREYRTWAEQGFEDILGPIDSYGKLSYRWIDLPQVYVQQISDDFFGGLHWDIIKRDRTTRAQFYQIVERDYPDFVCYPGGRLPLPIRPRIPSKRGAERTLFGA